MELQHLANTLKNLQRAKQDVEDNLNRSLREKDSIISQLQLSLEGKTKDMEVRVDIPSKNSLFYPLHLEARFEIPPLFAGNGRLNAEPVADSSAGPC